MTISYCKDGDPMRMLLFCLFINANRTLKPKSVRKEDIQLCVSAFVSMFDREMLKQCRVKRFHDIRRKLFEEITTYINKQI